MIAHALMRVGIAPLGAVTGAIATHLARPVVTQSCVQRRTSGPSWPFRIPMAG